MLLSFTRRIMEITKNPFPVLVRSFKATFLVTRRNSEVPPLGEELKVNLYQKGYVNYLQQRVIANKSVYVETLLNC